MAHQVGSVVSYNKLRQDSHRTTLQWSLKDALEHRGGCITSSLFQHKTGTWQVELWPFGRREDDKDFVSVFLNLVEGPPQVVRFTFSVTSLDGDRFQMGTQVVFTKEEPGWGYAKFLHHRFLEDKTERFYDGHRLNLEVAISAGEDLGLGAIANDQPRMEAQRNNACCSCTNEQGLDCVVCMERPATSGFAHGITCHKCVCEDCAVLLTEQPKSRCPVCREFIEHIILKFH